MKSSRLNIILNEDLESSLNSIGVIKRINNGEIFCEYCNKTINLRNLQLIIPVEKNIYRFICNDIKCIEKYIEGFKND